MINTYQELKTEINRMENAFAQAFFQHENKKTEKLNKFLRVLYNLDDAWIIWHKAKITKECIATDVVRYGKTYDEETLKKRRSEYLKAELTEYEALKKRRKIAEDVEKFPWEDNENQIEMF